MSTIEIFRCDACNRLIDSDCEVTHATTVSVHVEHRNFALARITLECCVECSNKVNHALEGIRDMVDPEWRKREIARINNRE
jgi:hypothetical protein